MIDEVISYEGKSRLLKTSYSIDPTATTEVAFASFIESLKAGNVGVDVTYPEETSTIASDGIVRVGTKLNRETLLNDAAETAIWGSALDSTTSTRTPSMAFASLGTRISAAESSINTNTSAISSLEARASNLEFHTTNNESRITAVEGALGLKNAEKIMPYIAQASRTGSTISGYNAYETMENNAQYGTPIFLWVTDSEEDNVTCSFYHLVYVKTAKNGDSARFLLFQGTFGKQYGAADTGGLKYMAATEYIVVVPGGGGQGMIGTYYSFRGDTTRFQIQQQDEFNLAINSSSWSKNAETNYYEVKNIVLGSNELLNTTVGLKQSDFVKQNGIDISRTFTSDSKTYINLQAATSTAPSSTTSTDNNLVAYGIRKVSSN